MMSPLRHDVDAGRYIATQAQGRARPPQVAESRAKTTLFARDALGRAGARIQRIARLRDDRRGLDFDFGLGLHERDHLDDAHCREVLAHDRAIGRADAPPDRRGTRCGSSDTRSGARCAPAGLRLREHRADVPQRLCDLVGEARALECAAARVPADLAGDEDLAALRRDAVAVARRARPAVRVAGIVTGSSSCLRGALRARAR